MGVCTKATYFEIIITVKISTNWLDKPTLNLWDNFVQRVMSRLKRSLPAKIKILNSHCNFFRFFVLGLLFLKNERNSRFDFSIRFLSAPSKLSISRGKISVPGLAVSYLCRSLFYLRPQARLARVSTMPRRSASHRHACIPSRERSGISESDFERFVCVEVTRRSMSFGTKLLEIVATNTLFRVWGSADWLELVRFSENPFNSFITFLDVC